MNKQPIETANDADLRSSVCAMQRAAKGAQELATRTGTALIATLREGIDEVEPNAQGEAAPRKINCSD